MRMDVRELQAGPRLAIAVVAGGLALVLAGDLGIVLAGMLAWTVCVALFLALTALAVAGCTAERVRARARALDERAPVISVIVVVAAAVSLGALGFVLQKPGGMAAARVALALIAVVLSWVLVHTMFALHYAHSYYGDNPATEAEDDRGGLAFPGDTGPPDYWDFFYFSFVVGMTCQVSDVQVTSRAMRHLTLVHGVLFNTGVLAFAVNIVAGAL
jgi:uncharacterized membrane protein